MEGITFIEIDGVTFFFTQSDELKIRISGNNNEQKIHEEENIKNDRLRSKTW
ncbi:hypothetical protein [Clostridium thermarum]|uniref:hypothetical protein n=1 Tax=Clostridium thermarum TaxID=1716543 RepID=UPI0013D54261|nr:hypothetical protein [Clostridium thermarum]